MAAAAFYVIFLGALKIIFITKPIFQWQREGKSSLNFGFQPTQVMNKKKIFNENSLVKHSKSVSVLNPFAGFFFFLIC